MSRTANRFPRTRAEAAIPVPPSWGQPTSRSAAQSDRADVYTRVTAEIVAAIEAGAGDWRMPWHHDGAAVTRPQNVSSGCRYRGVNVLALWIAAEARGFASGLLGTYRQWQAAGAQVRKAERGSTVVLWKRATSRVDDESDAGDAGHGRMFARAFTVFNCAQVDGYEPEPVAVLPESERIDHADAFIAALQIPTTVGAYGAHYRIDLDQIFMPPFAAFRDAASHLGTLFPRMCPCDRGEASSRPQFRRTFQPRQPGDRGGLRGVDRQLHPR